MFTVGLILASMSKTTLSDSKMQKRDGISKINGKHLLCLYQCFSFTRIPFQLIAI